MKILPVNSINLQQQTKNANNSETKTNELLKARELPKTVEIKQDLSNPTFKNCGAEYAIGRGTCSLFGIT